MGHSDDHSLLTFRCIAIRLVGEESSDSQSKITRMPTRCCQPLRADLKGSGCARHDNYEECPRLVSLSLFRCRTYYSKLFCDSTRSPGQNFLVRLHALHTVLSRATAATGRRCVFCAPAHVSDWSDEQGNARNPLALVFVPR